LPWSMWPAVPMTTRFTPRYTPTTPGSLPGPLASSW
jgi:hypothetical protein